MMLLIMEILRIKKWLEERETTHKNFHFTVLERGPFGEIMKVIRNFDKKIFILGYSEFATINNGVKVNINWFLDDLMHVNIAVYNLNKKPRKMTVGINFL